MATFNVSPEPRDPGAFRVGQGQPAFDFGSVIQGLGNLFEVGVIEKDNSNIRAITNQIDAVNQEATGALFSDEPQATPPPAGLPPEGTGLIGSGSSAPKPPPVPAEIGGLQNELTRLRAARDQNKLSHAAYLTRLEAATRTIRSQFPGYGAQIDDIVKSVTGIVPAKELLRIREKEIEAAEKEFNTQRKQGLDTFNEGLKKGLWNEKEIEILRQNTGDQGVQAYMTRVLAANYKVEADREAVAAKKTDAADAAIRAARFQADLFLGRISTATGNPTWKQLQEKMNQFAGMNPQQKATAGPELLMQINMAKAQAQQKIIAELSRPDSNGNSYISLINDKSKIDSIIEQSMLEINTMADAITNNDYGLAAVGKAYVDARENGWKLEQGPGQTLQKLKALGVPPEAISSAMVGSTWLNKMMDEIDVAMSTQGIGLVLTEPNKSMASVIADTNKQKQSPDVANAILNQPLDFIKNPQVTAPMAATAIDNVYGNGNLVILDTAKTPEQKKYLYNKLVSPEITARMVELGKQDPSVLDKYERFIVATSRSVLAEDMATLRQTVVDKGAGWDVKYENGKFALVQNDIGRSQVLPVPDPTGSANQPDPVLQAAVNNINNVLGVLQPVWQAKGGNPEEMTQKFFGVMNIRPDMPKQPTFMESLTRALTGDNDPDKVLKDIKSLQSDIDRAKARTEKGDRFAARYAKDLEVRLKEKQDLYKELTAGTPPAAIAGQERPNFTAGVTPREETPEVQPNEPRQWPQGTAPSVPAEETPTGPLPRFDERPAEASTAPAATAPITNAPAPKTSGVDPRQFAGLGPDGTFGMEQFRNARVDAGENPNSPANLARPAPVVAAGSTMETTQRVPLEGGGARSRGASRRATFSGDVTAAINQAASASGMDPNVLMAFADIESGGRPNVTTGSYKGLFQLSEKEFRRYGGRGDIYDPVENARVAALKLKDESAKFAKKYGRPATPFDLYMVHQQGWDGYAKHLENPSGKAWENMFRTGEGRQKGKRWAKMAIWGNIPTGARTKYFGMPKSAGKGLYSGIEYVDNVTSEDFLNVWRNRVGRGLGDSTTGKKSEEASNGRFTIGIGTFAGKKAAESPITDQFATAAEAIEYAEKLSAQGKSDQEVFELTGFSRGADGQWRFEIDDSQASLNKEILSSRKPSTLSSFLKHDELFRMYPQLKDIKVTFNARRPYLGSWNRVTRTLDVNPEQTDEEIFLTVLHETQHVIQAEEGFARGGDTLPFEIQFTEEAVKTDPVYKKRVEDFNAFMRARDILADNLNRKRSKIKEVLGSSLPHREKMDKVDALQKEADEMWDKLKIMYDKSGPKFSEVLQSKTQATKSLSRDTLRDIQRRSLGEYKKISGEVEARNVETRLKLTPEQRRQKLPKFTEDVPRCKQRR